MDALRRRIKEIIVESLHLEGTAPDDIGDDLPLFGEGLGLDSVDALELAMGLEDAFDVKLPEDRESRAIFRSVNTLAAWIEGQGALG